jgi:PHD/YefM family antitoxin component YafN of YafNO toxin-antitoxin module
LPTVKQDLVTSKVLCYNETSGDILKEVQTMPTIKPIAELDNLREISALCYTSQEPVFITNNGDDDLVIMSMEAYENKLAKTTLYEKLAEAEEDITEGRYSDGDEVFSRLRERYAKA